MMQERRTAPVQDEKQLDVREDVGVEESTEDVMTLRVRPGLRVRSRLRAGNNC